MTNNFFFFENRAVYEIMSKNVVEPDTTQITIWRRVVCWISKATRAEAHAHARAPTHKHTLKNM
jgi:predicted deacetylase